MKTFDDAVHPSDITQEWGEATDLLDDFSAGPWIIPITCAGEIEKNLFQRVRGSGTLNANFRGGGRGEMHMRGICRKFQKLQSIIRRLGAPTGVFFGGNLGTCSRVECQCNGLAVSYLGALLSLLKLSRQFWPAAGIDFSNIQYNSSE